MCHFPEHPVTPLDAGKDANFNDYVNFKKIFPSNFLKYSLFLVYFSGFEVYFDRVVTMTDFRLLIPIE